MHSLENRPTEPDADADAAPLLTGPDGRTHAEMVASGLEEKAGEAVRLLRRLGQHNTGAVLDLAVARAVVQLEIYADTVDPQPVDGVCPVPPEEVAP